MISLYFHIPFCTKKCPYCHFYVIPNRALFREILKEALLREWNLLRPLWAGKQIASIYFGGGTPSLFPEGIESLLREIRGSGVSLLPDCEITIEANPEEGSEELFARFRKMGANRISLGVQSLDDRSLETLERAHTAKKAKEAIFAAKRSGFENISIDLMYDLPEQTEASWAYSLEQLPELSVQHLSLYNLTIEPHTAFHKRKVKTAGSEMSFRLLQRALETLERVGLKRYEISAFAKEGFASRHNLGYWTGRPFLGFGPSAFSYWNGERYRNIANIHRYDKLLKEGKSPVDFRERLPYPADLKELLAVQLRTAAGVDLSSFPQLPEETIEALEKLKRASLLFQEGARIYLTSQGMLLYDSVAEEII